MATFICDSMTSWLDHTRISLPALPLVPDDPIMVDLFESQQKIGWDPFFSGRITKGWKATISTTYYQENCPGDSFLPDQWMQTMIDALLKVAMSLWR